MFLFDIPFVIIGIVRARIESRHFKLRLSPVRRFSNLTKTTRWEHNKCKTGGV